MTSRILPIAAVMIAVATFFAYVQPNWTGKIAETKAAIQTDKDALAAAKQYKEQQNALASARSAIEPVNLERLTTLLPDSVDNVRLILDINALAARSGLSLSNIDAKKNDTTKSPSTAAVPVQPSPGAAASAVGNGTAIQSARKDLAGSVDISLSAVGTYAALKTFLTSIESSARLLDVQDLTVKSSDTGVYTYGMTIRLYWLR